MSDQVRKLLIFAVVLLVGFVVVVPILPKILPKPNTAERARDAFEAVGMAVTYFEPADQPGLEANSEICMSVSGATVSVYHYSNEGKIAKQLEYQKKDAGSAMVETWNLAASLGAAPKRDRPSQAVREGMYMLVVTADDAGLVKRIAEIYRGL